MADAPTEQEQAKEGATEGIAPAAASGTPPVAEGTTPAAEGTAPAAEGTAPAAEGTAPAAEGTAPAPAAEGTAPAAEGTTPAAEGTTPAAEDTAPVAEGTAPAAEGTTAPAAEGTAPAPAAEGAAPAAEGTAPAAEGTTPAAEGTAPAAEGTAPAAESTAPAAEGTAPAAEGTAPAPAAEGTAPAAEGTAPAAEGTAPAAEGTAPAAEGTAPAAEGIAPAAEGTAPATEGTAPAAEGTTPAQEPAAAPEEEKEPEPTSPAPRGIKKNGEPEPGVTISMITHTETANPVKTTYLVSVKTGDLDGAGTDADVHVTLVGEHGRSVETELDVFFSNDFERNTVGEYKVECEKDLGALKQVIVQRNDFWLASAWFLECITVCKETKQDFVYVFPCHRWMKPGQFGIQLNDCCVPGEDLNPKQRAEYIELTKKAYDYEESYPGGPMTVKKLPDIDNVSFRGKFNLWKEMKIAQFGLIRSVVALKKMRFSSVEEMREMYDAGRGFPVPKNIDNWDEDATLGRRMLQGCNPNAITRLVDWPESLNTDSTSIEKFLEGKKFDEAVQAKKLYYITYSVFTGVQRETFDNTPADDMPDCYAIFYVRDDKTFVPILIQLEQNNKEAPVFFPDDDANAWRMAKFWFSMVDVNYQQFAARISFTRLIMEGVYIALNRTMSLSHPVHRFIRPYFRNLLLSNWYVFKGYLASKRTTFSVGSNGLKELVGNTAPNFLLLKEGNLPEDLKSRGVDDTEALPGYFYRDDGLLIYDAIHKLISGVIGLFYANDEAVKADEELQAWAKLMSEPSVHGGLGIRGAPDRFDSRALLIQTLDTIMFTLTAQQSATSAGYYDQYAFPASACGNVFGKTPQTKEITETDFINALPAVKEALYHLAFSKVMARKYVKRLGHFTIYYLYDPDATRLVEEFKAELIKIEETINKRNEDRPYPYNAMLPSVIPNNPEI